MFTLVTTEQNCFLEPLRLKLPISKFIWQRVPDSEMVQISIKTTAEEAVSKVTGIRYMIEPPSYAS